MTGDKRYGKVVINGLSVFDIVNKVGKKSRRYIASALSDVEDVLGEDSEEFQQVRKIFLDNFNDYTRSILIFLLGDIEGLQ